MTICCKDTKTQKRKQRDSVTMDQRRGYMEWRLYGISNEAIFKEENRHDRALIH